MALFLSLLRNPQLTSSICDPHFSDSERLRLLWLRHLRFVPALSAQKANPLSVPQLLRNLESDNEHVAASAARSLGVVFAPGGRGGEDKAKVVTQLIEHLSSQKGPEIRRQCAVALGMIRAAEAAEPMKKTLEDPEIEVVLAAGEAVGQILPVDEARKYLKEVGAGDAGLAKVGAFHGLSTIAKPEDAPFLLTGVGSENWRAQKACVNGLHRAVRAGADLSEDEYKSIAVVLGADTVNAADSAVHFFSHAHNPGAVAALRDAVDPEIHPDNWRQRARALRAIRHRNLPRSQPELPLVIRNLGDKTANVNNEVLSMLQYFREERRLHHHTLMPILVSELERAEPLRRRGAIMKQMHHDIDEQYASRVGTVAAKTLIDAASNEEEWPARAQALRIVGVTAHSGAIEEVANAVDSNIANVRSAAGVALERIGPVCPPEEAVKVAPILHPHLSDAVDWRKTTVAAGAIGSYANSETIDPLVNLLAHAVLNVRRDASRSLVLIANGEDADLKAQMDAALYAKLDANSASWEHGAPVLGALNDPKAVPNLTKMLASEHWLTQEAAARAVAALAMDHEINDQAAHRSPGRGESEPGDPSAAGV